MSLHCVLSMFSSSLLSDFLRTLPWSLSSLLTLSPGQLYPAAHCSDCFCADSSQIYFLSITQSIIQQVLQHLLLYVSFPPFPKNCHFPGWPSVLSFLACRHRVLTILLRVPEGDWLTGMCLLCPLHPTQRHGQL